MMVASRPVDPGGWMSFERARQPEQIAQRRESILEATLALFEEVGFDAIRLVDIGHRAGVSKASVYRYFESKEAIFLEVLARETEAWVSEAEEALAAVGGAGTLDDVARIIADSLSGRPRLGNLAAKLASVLERNVGADALRTFKRRQGAQTLRLVAALHAALPALSVAGAQRFVAILVTFQNGLFPAAHPPAAVAKVLAEPEFAPFRTDYRHALVDAARLLLGAFLSENAPASGTR
jgi:AcrR family transcriptional regulator